jgi:hypothetical protein
MPSGKKKEEEEDEGMPAWQMWLIGAGVVVILIIIALVSMSGSGSSESSESSGSSGSSGNTLPNYDYRNKTNLTERQKNLYAKQVNTLNTFKAMRNK